MSPFWLPATSQRVLTSDFTVASSACTAFNVARTCESFCNSFLVFGSTALSTVNTFADFPLLVRLNLLLRSASADMARLIAPMRSSSATFGF